MSQAFMLVATLPGFADDRQGRIQIGTGLQAYTGNFQGTGIACKHGVKYPKHVSVCFESQKYPDSPTKYTAKTKGWEISNPYLKPGEKYHSHLAYKFSVK